MTKAKRHNPLSRKTGGVDDARQRAGIVHPLGHREYKSQSKRPPVELTEEDAAQAMEFETPEAKELRQVREIALEAAAAKPGQPLGFKNKVRIGKAGRPKSKSKANSAAGGSKSKPQAVGIGQGKGAGGRKPGAGNAMPRILKELIFTAMDMVGRDGRGKDQAAGYLARLAIRKPELFSRFIEKMIPYTMSGPGGGPVQVTYDDRESIIRRMKERGMPVPKHLAGPEGNPKGTHDIDGEVVRSIIEAPPREHMAESGDEDDDILPVNVDDEESDEPSINVDHEESDEPSINVDDENSRSLFINDGDEE